MGKVFNGIELGELLGGYEIVNKPANELPQDLTSAVSNINGGILGATYQPIWYVGHQLVNGTNHLLICKEIRSTKDKNTCIVGLVINISASGKDATVVEIIEEAKLSAEVQVAFLAAEKQLVGVGYKPLAYVGSQVVKGVNHYLICQAKGIYPNSTPYAVVMCINVFENQVSVIGVAPLPTKTEEMICGYAFTW